MNVSLHTLNSMFHSKGKVYNKGHLNNMFANYLGNQQYKKNINANYGGIKMNQYNVGSSNNNRKHNSQHNQNKYPNNNSPNMKHNTLYLDNNSHEKVILAKQLGKGGEGTVYCMNNLGGKYVAKIYHKIDPKTEAKIEFMIKNKPSKIDGPSFIICWPEYKILDKNNKFVGYAMRKGFDNSVEIYELTKPKIKNNNFIKFSNTYPGGNINKLKLLINICVPLHIITDSNNYVMVDFKPQNILTDNKGKISILDTDSFQISENGKILFNARVATPEYTPKEYANVAPSKIKYTNTTDMFAIAVSFYQILMGIHPYVVKPRNSNLTTIADFIYADLFPFGNNTSQIVDKPKPHLFFTHLPKEIQELFVKTFTSINRPKVAEWGGVIANAINAIVENHNQKVNQKVNSIVASMPKKTPKANAKTKEPSVSETAKKAMERLDMINNNISDVEVGVLRDIIKAIHRIANCALAAEHYAKDNSNDKYYLRKAMALRCIHNLVYTYYNTNTSNCMDSKALQPIVDHIKVINDVFMVNGELKVDTNLLFELNKNPHYSLKGDVLVDNLMKSFETNVAKMNSNGIFKTFERNYFNKKCNDTNAMKNVIAKYKENDVDITEFTSYMIGITNALYSAKYGRVDATDDDYIY